MAQKYRYQPLDMTAGQIRLFQLLPGNGELLRIEFTYCLLTELPFDALSYKSNEEYKAHSITCECYTIRVSNTLHRFLQLLRQSGHDGLYWVDAICIDQNNDKETGYLVSRLPSIYHTAQRTLCLAGVEDPSFLQKITCTASGISNYQKSIVECLSEVDILHSTYRIPEHDLAVFGDGAEMFDSNMRHRLDKFLDQAYFTRYIWLCSQFFTGLLSISIWKIQEIVCSRNPVLFGGEQTVHWSDLAHALLIWLFFDPSSGPQSPATMFVLLCEAMRSTCLGLDSKHTKLPDLLLAIRSIPIRPFVFRSYARVAYSIATLRSPDKAHKISFDPRNGTGYSEVKLSEFLNILSKQPLSFSLTDDVDSDQRSWIANWNPRTTRFLLNHPASSFSASGRQNVDQPSVQVWRSDDGTLPFYGRCMGFVVDVIRSTSDYLPPRRHCDHYNVSDHCLFFANWYDFAKEHSDRAENDLLLEYADTIQARGCGHLWEDAEITPQDRIQKAWAFLDFLSDENADESGITNSIRLFHAACFPSHDRRFAVTRKGRFCLVPKNIQSGDLVCIPHNSRVPYIFRPRMEGHGFVNIGETFVHGIMHGQKSELKGREETEFILY
jgi:hypothetical protein